MCAYVKSIGSAGKRRGYPFNRGIGSIFWKRAKNNIHLDWNIEEHYPKLYCDKERIMQVLGILLDNAIAHAQSNDTIQMGAKAEANYIVFYVMVQFH